MESVSFVNLQNSIFIKADKKIHRKGGDMQERCVRKIKNFIGK